MNSGTTWSDRIYMYMGPQREQETEKNIWRNNGQKISKFGTSLAVQWLGLCVSTVEGPGLIPGQGTRIPQAMWHDQKEISKFDKNYKHTNLRCPMNPEHKKYEENHTKAYHDKIALKHE